VSNLLEKGLIQNKANFKKKFDRKEERERKEKREGVESVRAHIYIEKEG
jgi:hypothetical protein